MNIEFQKAIEKKRILHFAQGKRQVKKELQEAENDLAEALNRFESENTNMRQSPDIIRCFILPGRLFILKDIAKKVITTFWSL